MTGLLTVLKRWSLGPLAWGVVIVCLGTRSASAQDESPLAADLPRAVEPFVNYRDPARVMQLGGPLMWPILVCSVLAITFGLERLVSLRRGRVLPRRFLKDLFFDLDHGQLNESLAAERCRSNGSPAALVILAAVRRWGRPIAEIEAAINDGGSREVATLRRNLRGLQGAANIATLLGLLGTVLGMIDAFNAVGLTTGQPRAETLASGIAQALITTAFGLAVAIPSLFLHAYLSGKVERLVYELDHTALAVAERITAPSDAPSHAPSGSRVPHGRTDVDLTDQPASVKMEPPPPSRGRPRV
jgi:biopolymer transport protein ExbB